MKTKPQRRIADRIEDIRTAIANIRDDLGALDRAGFLADGKTQRAVVESPIVIGEAAARILQAEPSLETALPGIGARLRDAIGMRNLLAHEYFRIDSSVVWDTIHNDLPVLEAALDALSGNP